MGYQPPSYYAEYPEPQQYYRINLAALSWAEIRRSAGGAWLFFTTAPIVGVFKLLRAPMVIGEKFPREVSFEALDPAAYERSYHAVEPLFAPLAGLGFEHFTTFRVPEMPYNSTVFAFMNRRDDAYAAVYHVMSPMGDKKGMDFVTRFRDGSGLTTTNIPDGVALQAPAHHHRFLVAGASAEALWPAHQAEVARLLPSVGGLRGSVGEEDFIDSWRRSIRDGADFQTARGVFVPV
jgi:hypothetical protein